MIRCKFRCNSVTKTVNHWRTTTGELKDNPEYVYKASFTAVHDGSEENKAFYHCTPSGQLEIGTYKQDHFQVGSYYYLDLSIAE